MPKQPQRAFATKELQQCWVIKRRRKQRLSWNLSPMFHLCLGPGFPLHFSEELPTSAHSIWQCVWNLAQAYISRFLKKEAYENKFGSEKSLAQSKPEGRKSVVLGIRVFYSTSVAYLQSHLPLQNALLKALGCLNPLKRTKASSTKAIARLARKLQPWLDVSLVQDEWRVYSVDEDVAQVETGQRVDHFWRAVFCLKSADGTPRFSVLPKVVKADLILAQMNAIEVRLTAYFISNLTKEFLCLLYMLAFTTKELILNILDN